MRTAPEFDAGFMGQILAFRKGPAVVKSQRLMPIWTPSTEIVLPITEVAEPVLKPIRVVPAAYLDVLAGTRMSIGSYSDIRNGRCVHYTDRTGVEVMGYRFPKGMQ